MIRRAVTFLTDLFRSMPDPEPLSHLDRLDGRRTPGADMRLFKLKHKPLTDDKPPSWTEGQWDRFNTDLARHLAFTRLSETDEPTKNVLDDYLAAVMAA